MTEIIIKSRIKSRKVPENIISRSRLIDLVEKNSTKNLISLISPAGYGKTTLVLDYLNGKNKKYGWFHASEDITDFYTYIIYIIYALKHVNQNFGEDTLQIVNSIKESNVKNVSVSIKDITATFINEFYNYFDDEVFLVIDDLHNIHKNEWVSIFFESLVFNYPENLHIIITTRETLPFNTSKLEAKRNIFTITETDLEFKPDETDRVVNEIYSTRINNKEKEFLEIKMKGWITGIHLAMVSGRKLSSREYDENLAKENIFGYFANDIFDNLDKDIKEFLLKTSLLNEFSGESSATLLDLKDTVRIISFLVSKNLFIEKKEIKETGETVYVYHNLFRDYLKEKFIQEYGTDERNRFIIQLSDSLISINETEQAIDFLFSINQTHKCSELIIKNYNEYLSQNRDDIIWKWLELLPEEIINKETELILLKGILYKSYKGESINASEYFKRVINLSTEGSIKLKANLEYALILISQAKFSDAVSLLENLLLAEKNRINRANIQFVLADAYHRQGQDIEKMILPVTSEALEIANEENLEDLRNNIYDLTGRAYQARGIFVKSAYYYELALKNTTLAYHRFRIISNIIVTYCDSGNFEKAFDMLVELENIVARFPTPTMKLNFIRTNAVFSYDVGDFEKAREYFKEIIKISIEINQPLYLFWFNIQLGESYFLENKPDRAKSYYELALKYLDKSGEQALIEYESRELLLHDKESSDFENTYLKLINELETNKYTQELTVSQFYLADYYYKTGQYTLSIEFLKRALETACKNQYLASFELFFPKFRYLFDFALANNIEPDFIRGITVNLLERINASYISPEYKKRLTETIPALYDIDLRIFGGIEVYIRGKLIKEEQWIRKKSKLIFIYLLLNPEFKFTKDKIMDMFFPESSPETADNVFHQAITNIRNVSKVSELEEKRGKKKDEVILQNSPFVIYEDKILRLNVNYIYRIDTIEFDKYYHIYKSSESNLEEKIKVAAEAVKLYKGELLAGIYETWCEDLREVYHNKFTALCEFLSGNYKKKKMYFEAIEFSERLILADKLNENGYINIIECHCELGNINLARAKYQQLMKTYEDEYNEKPDKKIIDKIEEIIKSFKN